MNSKVAGNRIFRYFIVKVKDGVAVKYTRYDYLTVLIVTLNRHQKQAKDYPTRAIFTFRTVRQVQAGIFMQ